MGNPSQLSNKKYGVLIAVTLQNALYALLRRYTQTLPIRAASSEVLLLAEVLKGIVSAFMTTRDEDESDAVGSGFQKVLWLTLHSSIMFVLAAIYGAMNILSFVALQRIDAASFTVFAQLKVLTTAVFSVAILKRQISWTKWRALILVVCASILVTSKSAPSCEEALINGTKKAARVHEWVGYGAVIIEVILSGFASIYFEKVIKATNVRLSIWDRNYQLSLYSVLFYGMIIAYGYLVTGRPIGNGWSALDVAVAILGALGGILVAFSVKYTDSIMKSIAVSGAIVIAGIGGFIFLDGPMTLSMVIGGVIAIVALQNYTLDLTPNVNSDSTTPGNIEASGTKSPLLSKSPSGGNLSLSMDSRDTEKGSG